MFIIKEIIKLVCKYAPVYIPDRIKIKTSDKINMLRSIICNIFCL